MYQRLVDKDQIALDVESESDNAFDPTLLLFLAQPKQGVDPAVCEKAIYEEGERLQSSPVADRELEKAKNFRLAEFYRQGRASTGGGNKVGADEGVFGGVREVCGAA